MNKEREIRLLYPPIYLFLAFYTAICLDPIKVKTIHSIFNTGDAAIGWEKFVGIVASGIVLIIVTGFLIGTVSIVLLRLVFLIAGHSSYEAVLPEGCLNRIWGKLGRPQALNAKLTLFAATTFDHALLEKPIHEWLQRRWSSFDICIRSFIMLMFAFFAVGTSPIEPHYGWYIAVLSISIFFAIQAVFSWQDTMSMIDFQSYRSLPSDREPDAETSDTNQKNKSEDTQEKEDSSNSPNISSVYRE